MDTYSRIRLNSLNSAVRELEEAAQLIKLFEDKNDVSDSLEKLYNIALKYCELDVEYTENEKSIEKTEKFYKDNKKSEEIVKEKFDEFSKENNLPLDEASLSNHKLMIDYLKNIEIEFKTDDQFDEAFVPPTDPFSKNPINHPVKNKQCGHIYDENSIKELLSANKQTRCPYIGCPAKHCIKKAELFFDAELKQKIDLYNIKNENIIL